MVLGTSARPIYVQIAAAIALAAWAFALSMLHGRSIRGALWAVGIGLAFLVGSWTVFAKREVFLWVGLGAVAWAKERW